MNNFTQAFYITKSKLTIKWVFALFALLLFNLQSSFGQTTVYTEDFSTNTSATYVQSGAIGGSATWSAVTGGTANHDFGARRNTSPAQLELTNDAGFQGTNQIGWAFGTIPVSNFISPYVSTLSSNPGDITWTFNMRQIRPTASGFGSSSYGAAMVLGSTSTSVNSAGNGYAVTIGASGFIRLVSFTTGLAGTQTNIIAGSTNAAANYYSFKVIYTPSTNTWQLLARNDGASAFVDPTTGTLTAVAASAVNSTYTGTALANFGAYWQGSTAAVQTAFFDNIKVTVVSAGPSTDANLSAYTTTATGFTPTFAGATTSYNATVPFATTTTTVTATRNQAAATLQVRVNGGSYTSLANATASGPLSLNVGANPIDVLVTAEDGTTTKTYTLTVTRAAASTVSSLSALTTTAGTLTPSFATGTTSYTASVSNATTSVTVTPTRTNAGATIQARVNGGSYASVTSGSASGALALSIGANTIDVLVTAEDGTTTTTYSIAVTRSAAVASTDATLSALTTTATGLTPTFASGTTSYTASVLNATTSVTVTPTRNQAAATIQVRVNGGSYTTVASGSASSALSLNFGNNPIDVKVTAEDGTTIIIYTVTVNRPASTVATLASLSLNTGVISPTFTSGTIAYTQTVANGISGVNVTPTVTDANATIRVRTNAAAFATLASGATSSTLGLTVGSNTLDVEVTAQDGTTIITYTVTITRSLAADSSLSALSTTAGTLAPSFAGGTFSYNIAAAVPYATAVTVSAARNQANATMQIRVNGGSYTSLPNATATAVTLAIGANTIDVLVTAQNSTTSTYSITVTRSAPSNVATLSALTTTAGTLTPTFATGTKTYAASVVGTTASITVTPTRTQANATIQARVNGGSYVSVTSGSPSSALVLNVGVNPIEVLVTAQDGTTTDLYIINVTRAAPPIWVNPISPGTTPWTISNPFTSGQTVDANLTVSGIGLVGAATATASDRCSSNTWPVNPAGIDTAKYFEFTLTPTVNYKIDFTNFKFTNQLSSATGSATLVVRSSLDGYTTNITPATLTIAGGGSTSANTVDLSGGSFQNVQAAITFRVYLYNVAATGNAFSINDFEFNGAVALAPPSPEINVVQGSSIASGGTKAFGNQENGTNSGALTFTIENLGNDVLNLTGTPKVAISGTDAAEFTINQAATTATVAATTGITTFTVTFTPGSAGAKTAQLSIANNDTTGGEDPYLINLTGTSTVSQLSSVSAAAFTPTTNIPYGSYTSNNITNANSLEVGQFTLQDGADNDTFGTTINTITFSLSNSANIQKVALYDGATELQEIAAGATNVFNSGLGALTTTDGGSKTFSIRVTFNTSVTDNQNFQFAVTNVTADGAGSGFAATNGGGATTSITGNNNKIAVTATKLKFGTVLGSSITVPLPNFTVDAVDANDNIDLDKAASVTLSTNGANATFSNPYALTGGSINISNVVYSGVVQQTGIKLTASATGLSPNADSNTFDILTVTWPANSYRTLTGGTWENSGSTSTWERFVSNVWTGPVTRPLLATTDFVYITKAITGSAITASNIVIQNLGTLTYGTGTCAGSMLVETGGTLQINGVLDFTGATVTVESGGTFNVNYSTASGITTLWAGTEDFQNGSTVNIQNWNYGAGSGANRLIQNPSIITTNTAGYYFGNLTISGAPSALFVVVETGQTNVKICQNNFTASNSAQVVAFGNSAGSAIIGGNVVGNSTSTGSFAFSTVSGLYTTTINGNLSGSGAINLSTQLGAQTSIVQLKGNLSIPLGASLSVTSDTGTIVFSGTSGTQTLSIAGTLNTRVAFEVGDGTNASEVQLINQNLALTNAANKVTVNDKGVLDFNYKDITGSGPFELKAGGTLKITSNVGVNATGNNTGNLQNTGLRTISQSGIFHYVGNTTPQATGNAVTSPVKVIIEKTNPTDVVNLSQATPISGALEIREGTLVETATLSVSGTGELKMSGGTYKTAVTSGSVPLLSGAFNLTAGTVELNAGAAQTLKGKVYANLTINLSSGNATIDGDVTVNNVLNLTNGKLVTTAPYKVISTATGSVVKTNGWVNGNLQRYIGTLSTAIPFDIGDATNYTPVTLQFASPTGTGSVIVKQTNGIIPSSATSIISSTKRVDRYYTLTNNGVGNINYSATFNFIAGDVLGGANTNDFKVGKYDGSTWTYPTVGTKTATSTQATGLSSISPSDFYIGEGTFVNTIWDGSAWSNGIPNSGLEAIINGTYNSSSVGAGFIAKKLTINSGKTLTLYAPHSLVITNEVINNAGQNGLVIESGASLIQINNVTNTGFATVKRDSNSLYRLDYTMWSSPVTNGNQFLTNFSPLTSNFGPKNIRFYTYDSGINLFTSILNASSAPFELAKGYLIRMPNENPANLGTGTPYYAGSTSIIFKGIFTGVLNNGNVSLTGLSSGSYNGIGNPYPSAIDSDKFIDAGNTSTGVLYFWRNRNIVPGTSYATYTKAGATANGGYTPNGSIGVGQGFVTTAPVSGTITFTNLLRTTNVANFLRTKVAAEKDRIWINLLKGTDVVNQILLAYMDGATTGVDFGIDGKYINDSPMALTSNIDNQEYIIQGRPEFTDTDEVLLNFKTDVAGEYTIAKDNVEGLFANNGQAAYLVDALTGLETNLQNNSYTFTTAIGTFNNRFKLIYKSSVALNVDSLVLDQNSISVYKQSSVIHINAGAITMKNVKVFDIAGRLVLEQKEVNATTTTLKNLAVANQVLLIKITAKNNKVVTKKVIF